MQRLHPESWPYDNSPAHKRAKLVMTNSMTSTPALELGLHALMRGHWTTWGKVLMEGGSCRGGVVRRERMSGTVGSRSDPDGE